MLSFSRLLRRTAPAGAEWIDAATLVQRLAGEPTPLVIDVRGPDEFTGPLGHIGGAINVPLPELSAHLADLTGRDRALVLVCKTDRRSAAAAAQLCGAGASEVAVLRGGMEEWRALGLA